MKTFLIVFSAVVLAVLTLLAGAFFALRATLAPMPGEWSVPLVLGPLTIQAGVPSMLRLATSAWSGPLLHGRTLPTRYGVLHLAWAKENYLQVRCAPCVLQPPGLGEEPLRLPEVQLTVRRLGEQLWGGFAAGKVRGEWAGRMAGDHIRMRVGIPSTPLADGYALFASDIPEVQRAQIDGSFSLVAELSLPEGTLTVKPHIEGFAVSGLGTEALAGARSSCTKRASKLTTESWLSRAVVAAEDQRFWEHPGYDLAEVAAAFQRNNDAQRIARGASTLSQQTAKLLVTGGERSLVRKLRELLYAVELERTLGKPRILRLYLENAPWGEGLCGAEAAARHYFGVRAHELTIAQAGWLAAMLHNPDAEAQRWAATGKINTARAQWVVLGMRGLPRTRKMELADAIADTDWKPWWAAPMESK
jgi:monofunctional biosynthetic peptidoglycan transglycosylase